MEEPPASGSAHALSWRREDITSPPPRAGTRVVGARVAVRVAATAAAREVVARVVARAVARAVVARAVARAERPVWVDGATETGAVAATAAAARVAESMAESRDAHRSRCNPCRTRRTTTERQVHHRRRTHHSHRYYRRPDTHQEVRTVVAAGMVPSRASVVDSWEAAEEWEGSELTAEELKVVVERVSVARRVVNRAVERTAGREAAPTAGRQAPPPSPLFVQLIYRIQQQQQSDNKQSTPPTLLIVCC